MNKIEWKSFWDSAKLYICAALFLCSSYYATVWVGYLFGWIIGASVSPIGATVAPLIFGLLAVVGIGGGIAAAAAKGKQLNLWALALTAFGVWLFCGQCFRGISVGIRSRGDMYSEMSTLLPSWNSTDAELRASIYQLRWKMQAEQKHSNEFEAFSKQVIEPVLADSQLTTGQKKNRILAILASLSNPTVDDSDSSKATMEPPPPAANPNTKEHDSKK